MNRRNFNKIIATTSTLLLAGATTNLAAAKSWNKEDVRHKLIYPPHLKKGDKVSLICPASPTTKEKLDKAVANIVSLGLEPVFDEEILLSKKGYLAGSDALRLRSLHEAFSNKNTKAVWCVRGGYGTPRILDAIDYKLIKRNPKVFIGFSDITALHVAIHQHTGLVTFHGTVGVYDFPEYTVKYLKNTLFKSDTYLEIDFPESLKSNAYVITEGSARGNLVGGNLSLLTALVGTPYACDMKDKIVFIEEIEERPYKIDRMLTQLLLSGDLRRASAIVLGVFDKCEADPNSDSLTLKETLTDRLGNLGIPVVYGMPFGHITSQCVIPYGVSAELLTDGLRLTLEETGVI
ncbi:MAG: LD-carboxypeptidase [Saprospiraceae bacterium]|nr:LD-carboxypeptidase [Saprospiraceae bacterium]